MAKRILAVEFSPAVREVVALTLGGAGYEVVSAHDESEALQCLAHGNYDLLVADMLNRSEAIVAMVAALRNLLGRERAPMVLLTGEYSHNIGHRNLSGVCGYVAKPFNPNQLLAVVRTVLKEDDDPLR